MDVKRAIQKTRSGDSDAFSGIVLHYQSMIRGYIALFVINHEDVLDLAQETFMAAFRQLDKFDMEADFKPWLRGIARNLTLKHLRDSGRRKRRESDAVQDAIREYDEEELQSGGTETPGLRELRLCLEKLKKSQAAAFRIIDMRYFNNMSAVRIARTLRRREGTVRMTLLRSRRLLAECIEQEKEAGNEART